MKVKVHQVILLMQIVKVIEQLLKLEINKIPHKIIIIIIVVVILIMPTREEESTKLELLIIEKLMNEKA